MAGSAKRSMARKTNQMAPDWEPLFSTLFDEARYALLV